MWNAVFSFSIKPLRLFSIMGSAILAMTLLLLPLYVVLSFVTDAPRGLTTNLVLSLLNLGVMSLGIGVLGEYVAKIYTECKRRPLWLVDYTINVNPPELPGHAARLVEDHSPERLTDAA
jgi:dolichol-phosphate mannosyltransferase